VNTLLLIGTTVSLLLAGAFFLIAWMTAQTSITSWRPPALAALFWFLAGSVGVVFIARALP
jgi:hypothetical protein